MELRENEEVRYLSFKNEVSDEICTIIEICDNGKTIRLKKPNGEIMRIHHDRIRVLDNEEVKKNIVEVNNSDAVPNDKFNPWLGISNGEVWTKQSKFNDTITLKSFVIINLDSGMYRSINAYNDKFSDIGVKEFKLKNHKSHISKLEKKGYKKIERGAK